MICWFEDHLPLGLWLERRGGQKSNQQQLIILLSGQSLSQCLHSYQFEASHSLLPTGLHLLVISTGLDVVDLVQVSLATAFDSIKNMK